jgi:hypothetical protein
VRSYEEVEKVRCLVSAGLNDCEIARLTGIPRATVRDWRANRRWLIPQPAEPDLAGLPDSYVYLLGLYLGDGCLSTHPRGVFKLRVALDERYPGIIDECSRAMQDLLSGNRPNVQRLRLSRAVEVNIYSTRLPLFFPQHGPGRKHDRRITLTEWQQELVSRRPGLLLRGLIHSDGCRFTNTVRHKKKIYEYPRYNFSNRSADIKRIFCDACDCLGIEWRVMNRWNISVARRASVARLDEFVGPKA